MLTGGYFSDESGKPYVANGLLVVPAVETGAVEVYTIDGKMVKRLPVVDYSADLTDLAPASVYVLCVKAEGYNASLKYRN